MDRDKDFNTASATPQELGLQLIALIKTPKNGASGNNTLVARCEELLERRADIETRDGNGMTPLLWASSNFRVKILQLLIDRGADAHARDKAGASALDHARKKKQKPALPMLQAAQLAQLSRYLEKLELQEPITVRRKPLRFKHRPDKTLA